MSDPNATPKPNTVTKDQLDDLIARSEVTSKKMGRKTTVVCLILPNGFEVVESSGCVDPDNYSHEQGVEVCMKRIVDKLWLLEGYALQLELEQP